MVIFKIRKSTTSNTSLISSYENREELEKIHVDTTAQEVLQALAKDNRTTNEARTFWALIARAIAASTGSPSCWAVQTSRPTTTGIIQGSVLRVCCCLSGKIEVFAQHKLHFSLNHPVIKQPYACPGMKSKILFPGISRFENSLP
ncbi:helix-turn-helix domain protein [Striga asiatica]|uniref:Helix-turn-helix domain protein n=1 Tax=Striga asiatica TaxID=4170 RepID=A0A5A7P6D1_STRAF|nr:helix-turn-helix domain protein [Striga asiatica]